MTSRDGLWQPIEPSWLIEGMADETLFVKGLREPEPEMTATAPYPYPYNVNPVQLPSNGSAIATALVRARSEIRTIAKDSTNPHFKSKYVSLDAILEAVVPILNANGLTIVQGCVAPDRDDTGRVTAFTVRTTLLHTSGESLDRDVIMPVAKSDPQGAGAALTYGRRYGISALLGLATDEDDDGNSASRGAKQRTRTERKPARSAADVIMPMGHQKGKRLGDIDTEPLASALAWCRETAPTKFAALIGSIEEVLEERRLAAENAEVGHG